MSTKKESGSSKSATGQKHRKDRRKHLNYDNEKSTAMGIDFRRFPEETSLSLFRTSTYRDLNIVSPSRGHPTYHLIVCEDMLGTQRFFNITVGSVERNVVFSSVSHPLAHPACFVTFHFQKLCWPSNQSIV